MGFCSNVFCLLSADVPAEFPCIDFVDLSSCTSFGILFIPIVPIPCCCISGLFKSDDISLLDSGVTLDIPIPTPTKIITTEIATIIPSLSSDVNYYTIIRNYKRIPNNNNSITHMYL